MFIALMFCCNGGVDEETAETKYSCLYVKI